MKRRFEAFIRGARSLFQGAFATGVMAAVAAAQAAMGDGAFQPRVIAVAAVTAGTTAAVSYIFTIVAPYLGATSPSVEAIVRGLRTLLAGGISVGIIAAGDAVGATLQGGTFAPWAVGAAAVSAATTAVVAFVHNYLRPRAAATT